jgi:hypothetical protein
VLVACLGRFKDFGSVVNFGAIRRNRTGSIQHMNPLSALLLTRLPISSAQELEDAQAGNDDKGSDQQHPQSLVDGKTENVTHRSYPRNARIGAD